MTSTCPLSLMLCCLAATSTIAAQPAVDSPALPPAYAPLVQASAKRVEEAQKTLTDWKAGHAALLAELKALEKKISVVAEQLGGVEVWKQQIQAADERVKALDAELKKNAAKPFTTVAELAKFDEATDASAAAKADAEQLKQVLAARTRELIRRDPQGAKLADDWESLFVKAVAAGNEMALAQARRDTVSRGEGGVLAAIKQKPDVRDSETVRVEIPPPADAPVRREQFEKRDSPESVRALGDRFFSQMTLTLPGLEKTAELAKAGDYRTALEAYKNYFFTKLLAPDETGSAVSSDDDEESRDGAATIASLVFPPPTDNEIKCALALVVGGATSVKGKTLSVETRLGIPGSINWVFPAATNEVQDALLFDICKNQCDPGFTGDALLHSYAVGGPKEHLQRWTEVLDDWCMNWQRDVEASPLPVRDYHLLYVSRIQAARDRLKILAQMRPSFVEDLPAATLARWLMAMNEEYVASAIRLGRSGLYNFRIMALNSMIPTSLKMQEFHIHQWAVREGWRQVDDNFIYKIRRDGANFEFANDGHENTDQFMTLPFNLLRSWNPQPAWTEPFWADEFMDNFLSNARYRVNNIKQDGYCYRLSVRDQRQRYIGAAPEYKVDGLANEDEVRRRLWKVFQTGKPEAPPQINTEGMAFQGYYYLRSGWEPDDYFLYFQSIGQPILSGREENTGFSLYGHDTSLLLNPATVVDGRMQNIHHGLVMDPGGKAPFACYGKPDAVKNGRFLANDRFDFVEGAHDGVYSFTHPRDSYDVFGTYGYESALSKAQGRAQKEGIVFVDKPITGVRQARQVLSIRGRETYIVTDYISSEQPHRFTQDYTIYTPVRADRPHQRLQVLRDAKIESFTADVASRTLTTHNIGLPNVHLRHIGAQSIEYTVRRDARPDALLAGSDPKEFVKKFSKRDRQQGEKSKLLEFGQIVAMNWNGQGHQVLITLVTPSAPNYSTEAAPAILRDVKPLESQPDRTGFTAKFANGGDVAYIASFKPASLKLGNVEATASALLVTEGNGIALDCAKIAGVVPPVPDFTFRIESGGIVFVEPIYRPIQPVVIEPKVNVFTDSLTISLACATRGVAIRYTLDGSKPTPQSPIYSKPFTITETCRMKARAFRAGVTNDVWQQDGTHATVVYSGVFRKESPAPALAADNTKPGLRYDYFEGPWTEVMARSLTMPAKETGVLTKLLDVSPRKTDGAFGIRYSGLLEVPQDGVYTFHAPPEFIFPDIESGYDLRVFVDGTEWYPAVRWQGHGDWSVALKKGKHTFQVVFADLRLRPHKVELMWGFPHPDFTWKGVAPSLLISGPGFTKQPIADAMLSHRK